VREPSSAFTPMVCAPPFLAAVTSAVFSSFTAARSILPRNLLSIIWSEVEMDRL